MEGIRSHKDLNAWKKSVELVTEIYQVTKRFPGEELYGLTTRRCGERRFPLFPISLKGPPEIPGRNLFIFYMLPSDPSRRSRPS